MKRTNNTHGRWMPTTVLLLMASLLMTQCSQKVGCYYNTMSAQTVTHKDTAQETPDKPTEHLDLVRPDSRVHS